jgi:hypothetical protein
VSSGACTISQVTSAVTSPELEQLDPLHVARVLRDALIEDAGDHVGVDLDAVEGLSDRSDTAVAQPRGARADEHDGPLQRIVRRAPARTSVAETCGKLPCGPR